MSMSSWQFVLHGKNRILKLLRCGLSSCNNYTDIESYSNSKNFRDIFSSKGLLVEMAGVGRRPPRSRAPAVLTGDLHRLPSRYRSPLAVLGLPARRGRFPTTIPCEMKKGLTAFFISWWRWEESNLLYSLKSLAFVFESSLLLTKISGIS